METPTLSVEDQTKIKSYIEAEFIAISQIYVPELRAFLTTNNPGNPIIVLNNFKKRFDALFTLSNNKEELNQKVVNEVREWLNTPLRYDNSKEIAQNIKKALDLFEAYKKELFKYGIIKLS